MLISTNWFRLIKDRRRAFPKEACESVDNILHKRQITSFWNLISCLKSFLNENPASDFFELKISFSKNDWKMEEYSESKSDEQYLQ